MVGREGKTQNVILKLERGTPPFDEMVDSAKEGDDISVDRSSPGSQERTCISTTVPIPWRSRHYSRFRRNTSWRTW